MSDAEKLLAHYFLDHIHGPDEDLNIKDIASRSQTSIATVVRFCKTLGFKGFSEFKYSVQNGVLAPLGGELRIGSNDGMGAVKQKVAEYIKRNIVVSIQHTDNKELERAIDALDRCKRIIISAVGTATGVALAAVNAFLYIGIPCFFPTDVLTMLRSIYLCRENDIVIGISNCGYNKDVVDAMKLAKDRGVTTIGVSGVRDSLMSKYTDIVLSTKLEDNSMALDIISVGICQLVTLQALQIGYLARHNAEVTAKMKNLYTLNDVTRYELNLEQVKNKRVRF
jgi:DNA-binding MurR/RpiR family transcriptional regulator